MPRATAEARHEYYLQNRERILEQRRQHYIENTEELKDKTKKVAARNSSFRKKLLSEFDCLLCGESDSDLIDWHHVNESEKLFNISHTSHSHDDWWNEVLKCIPVCVLCHRKIHTNKLCLMRT